MAEQKDNYSREADQTRYLWIVGIIGMTALIILFALEITAMVMFKLADTDGNYKAFIFTPEIVHTLIPVTIGVIGTVGGFIFGREQGKMQERNGNAQSRGRAH